MDKKGFWALLASVSKAWKTLFTRTNDSFRYRQAAGDDNILLPEKNGRAVIDTIYGNTVKFNQLAEQKKSTSVTIDGVLFTYDSNGKCTISGTATNGNTGRNIILIDNLLTFIKNHIYIVFTPFNVAQTLFFSRQQAYVMQYGNITGNVGVYRFTWTSDVVDNLVLGINTVKDKTYSGSGYFKIFDLTDIFGENNEPTTVEEVEAWLALNVGTQDYYPYDAGSLISFKGQGVKSVGWNKWDENTYLQGAWLFNMGDTFSPSGTPSSFTTYICGSHIFPCLPNKDYYAFAPYTNAQDYWTLSIIVLDKNLKVIQKYNASNVLTITTASDAAYLLISHVAHKVNEVMVDIVPSDAPKVCVNLSDLAKNGTYEPYHEEIVDLSGAYINVWDEQWEQGGLVWTTGQPYYANDRIRSKNFCRCIPGANYYNANTYTSVIFYDINKNYVAYIGAITIVSLGGIFPAPANAYYFKIVNTQETTYQHDICINVSNADINGTYFPHALQSVDNYDHSGATQFDIMTNEQLIKKCKTLIFKGDSSENWSYSIGFSIHLDDYFNMPLYGICNKFKNTGNGADGTFNIANNKYACFYDSTITSLENWKTQLQTWYNQGNPLTLIYPLSTPVTIPINPPINMLYKVDKYSTEEVIFPESADGSPTSTNIVVDIDYQKRG